MDKEIVAQFFGAFFAAIFAILTLAISNILSAIYRRNKDHFNFTVRLESKLNRHLSYIFPIIYIIDGVHDVTKNGNVSFNNLDAIKPEAIGDFHDLLDLDLINDVASYDNGLEILNSDLSNLSATYSEFRSALISKQITIAEFQAILPNLPSDLKHLIGSWENHLDILIDLQVQTRLILKRDRKRLGGINWLLPLRRTSLTQKEVKQERLKLMQEMEEVKRQSQKQIERIEKRHL